MSFRFNLGDVIVPKNQKLVKKVPVRVEAHHLDGFMRVRAISTGSWYMVKDEDFELLSNTNITKPDY
ncbi:MAG TPA: hypothetical protein EYN67_15300 [Flavobacteriales bacterium]|nr:hypothetical protein [Flavobacteriales bacterium]